MIETMTLHQASKYLRDKGLSLCSDTLADGLEQGVYPFGVCIRTDRSRVFQIFKKKLDAGLRSGRSKHGRLHIDAGHHRGRNGQLLVWLLVDKLDRSGK